MVRSGFSSLRFTTRERTEATPLAVSFALEGLRYRSMDVEAGTVRGVTVYTDAMDWTLAPAVERALAGSPFRRDGKVHGELPDVHTPLAAPGCLLGDPGGVEETDLRCLLMRQDI